MKTLTINSILIKILTVAGVLLAGFLSSLLVAQKVYSRMTADINNGLAQIESQYSQELAQETDAEKLVKTGVRQSDVNLPALALISLNRATTIEPNYRDGWLALGLAQFKTGDTKAALDSFQAAEKLDPICAKTYELLKMAYEKLDDPASAQKAQEKWDFLTKT